MITENVDLNDPLIFKLWAKAVADEINPEDIHLVGATGEPAFGSGWDNYNTTHSVTDRATVGFYKQFDRVYLGGLCDHTGTGTGTDIFTLPEGYRPSKHLLFTTTCTSNALARVDILSTGEVRLVSGDGSDFVSLDGISFRI